jgi:sulfur carrier protein
MGLTVTLNGQAKSLDTLDDGASLEAVVAALGLKADRVAIEQNGEIVSRRTWAGQRVGSGDRLEVVHFVGGGAPDLLAGLFGT